MGSKDSGTLRADVYSSADRDKALTGRSDSSDGSSLSELSESDQRCGYINCKPDCLQQCAKPRFVLVCMCLFAFVETYVQWGLINVNLSTWERRYQLKSTQSAWIVTSQDITQGVVGPIFGYLAAYYHKGRMVTAGTVFMGIGSLLFLVPHFASGVYELSGAYKDDTCDLSSNVTGVDPCEEGLVDTDMDRWLPLFCFAQVIFGFASCTVWTVGIPWIDDGFSREDSVMAMGIFNTISALGSCCGFILGGLFLGIYVDIGRVDMELVTIDSSDPRWVGAWWIGFFFSFILAIPLIFIMACFPRELPAVAEKRRTKPVEAYKGIGLEETQRQDFGKTCSDLGISLKLVLCNPVFMMIVIGGTIEIGGVTAFAAFLPKILQFQFGLTPGMAALVAGAVVVPGAAVGQLLGGVIPKCAKLQFRGIFWMMIICQFICVLCSPSFLITCPSPDIAGYNAEYPFNSTVVEDDPFTQACNVDCNCTTLEFNPICSTNGMAYFNPCYASCATESEVDGVTVYGNCSCLPNATSWEYQAEAGICPTVCTEFWIFMAVFLVIIICTFIENTGGYALVLRVVPEKQRSFAFGIQNPFHRFLGTVPIPILFGLVFDTACDVWQDNCGENGSCWIYDPQFLAMGIFIALIVVKGVAAIAFITGVCLYKPPSEVIKDIVSVVGDMDQDNDFHSKAFDDVHNLSEQPNGAVKQAYLHGTDNYGFDENPIKTVSDFEVLHSSRF